MTLFACGINHKTAPIQLRERLAFANDNLPNDLSELVEQPSVHEAAILSTCNRTEIYCHSEEIAKPLNWLSQHRNMTHSELAPHLYIHQNDAAIRHLMRVATGLDSMVLGEPQIFGQMKQAFATASEVGAVGCQLERLFRHVFSATKLVRTKTAIGANPVSIAYTAINLAKHIFADLKEKTCLLIGAGDTIELTLKHLMEQGVKTVFIANRSIENGERLAHSVGGTYISLKDIPKVLPQIDIVVSATNSPTTFLEKSSFEEALKQRKHKPIYIVDLAMPRDIDPEAGKLRDVYLYNIDDLQNVIEKNKQDRVAAVEQAEAIIEIELKNYHNWQKSLNAASTITYYREKIGAIKEVELEKALNALQHGENPETVLKNMSNQLIQKIMHGPSAQLRNASIDDRKEILATAQYLFEIDKTQ